METHEKQRGDVSREHSKSTVVEIVRKAISISPYMIRHDVNICISAYTCTRILLRRHSIEGNQNIVKEIARSREKGENDSTTTVVAHDVNERIPAIRRNSPIHFGMGSRHLGHVLKALQKELPREREGGPFPITAPREFVRVIPEISSLHRS